LSGLQSTTNTSSGVDDVLALLLALSASPEELEVAMISVTYGNVPLQRCDLVPLAFPLPA
jgi:inosine-uridine nucleoside N-ribohydrolase